MSQGRTAPVLVSEALVGEDSGAYLFSEEFDPISRAELALSDQGHLTVRFYRDDLFPERDFLMVGAITLDRLDEEPGAGLPEWPALLTVAF